MAKTPTELLAERKKRVIDAIALKVPDRVPIYLPFGVFGAKYAGITVKEAFENTPKWQDINEKLYLEYQPDFSLGFNSFDMVTNEILGNRRQKWPGHGVGPDASYQFVEGEYMKAEEYDDFLNNPGDFFLRTYLSRIYSGLEGFKNMAPTMSLMMSVFPAFSQPDVIAAFKTIIKAAESSQNFMKENSAFGSRIEAKGFYSLIGVGNVCPFDAVSDFLRGLKGTTIDMFRHPDKLLAAQEKLVPFLTGGAIARSRMAGSSFCFVALHRGSDAFMSVKQFEKFYWPGLKNMLRALIDASIIPFVFWEGTMDSRLEYLRELPKGKVLGWFDRTDLFRAKELIGDTMCICGGMPISLLTSGTPEQIKNYAKRLIDVVGKGGGFIMGPITELDNTKPELVKVWVDFTREYGVYR